MNKTVYMVYWTDPNEKTIGALQFTDMVAALSTTQEMRKAGMLFVTMVSENADNVGLMGVESVIEGKCPDGGDFLGRLSRYSVQLKRGR